MTKKLKPREFWIQKSHMKAYEAPDDVIGAIHVREVVPIDWEKLWRDFNQQELNAPLIVKHWVMKLVNEQLNG